MTEITNGWDVSHLVMHSAFDELSVAERFTKEITINIDECDSIKSFFIAGRIECNHSNARRHLVKATALFQAGMEALINHWISKYPELKFKGSFVETWKNAFAVKKVSDSFDCYASFYKDIRIAIIHPENADRIKKINNLTFWEVYSGIKCGWDATKILADAIGEKHDDNSWEIMCNLHGLSPNCIESDFPNLKVMSSKLYKKHLDHFNSK